MAIKSYNEAVDYLESFIEKVRFRIDRDFLKHHDPLTRMRVLLNLLGSPQDKFPSILIGGTSGKGSTVYLISHILTTAGYKVGLTISPHLQKVNERLQVNNQSIPDEGFLKLLNTSILSSIKEMSEMEVGAPSYFEILIAMAFLYFVEQKVDIAVVEVGMGGEYDATNTLYPLIAVLTNVSLDHTNVLGGTVQKIAKTKIGIIKGSPRPLNDSSTSNINQPSSLAREHSSGSDPSENLFKSSFRGEARPISFSHAKAPRELKQNLVVVTGVKQPSVIDIVESRCKEVGAELFKLGKDFEYRVKKENIGGSVFDLTTTHDRGLQLNDLNLSLLGRYQVENASLAIETVLQLEKFGFKVSEEHIREALKTAFFPGRFEIISCHPEFISGSILMDKDKMLKQSMKQVQDMARHDKGRTIQLILDGAHNPTKMRAFIQTLQRLYPENRKIFILAFKKDKNIKPMVREILRVADKVIATEFSVKTDMSKSATMPAESIKEDIKILRYYNTKKIIYVEKEPIKALDKALNILVSEYLNINSIIVVTGSLYLVGEIRNML